MPVPERVTAPAGEVETPLDEEEVREAARALAKQGVEAVASASCSRSSTPTHERRVGEILAEELPGVYLFLRSDVAPRYREYEAFSTTALCAYVGRRPTATSSASPTNLANAGIRVSCT